MLRKWEELPDNFKNQRVRKYYDILNKKRGTLLLKRLFDVVAGVIAFVVLIPLILLLFFIIKLDSKGTAIFRQVRVTQYNKTFHILKFRTMVENAEKIGTQVTMNNDSRVTKIGKFLRKYRLDEILQLINIIKGDMSFVGTRPEVVKFVEHYSDEMMATLLLPAGVTSETSIIFKEEERILNSAENADEAYINLVLPEKMKYNLLSLEGFSFYKDIKTMIKTVLSVIKRDSSIINIDNPAEMHIN